ncbi:hypothetical protein KPL40_17900 [Clostridium gasigenes]|uniref:hypothetical protein n=1 Tax=Clostridium gasigenes TaxID=94869 RepID=UPI001C0B4D54|nr:hypothetical protein [Clostridium gasigenes]MBU3134295.1 hypothetical protein [Clostridium gasigenes]
MTGRNEIYSYGSDSSISKINVIDKEIKKEKYNEGPIKRVEYVNNIAWGIDNGYFHEDQTYKFNIINLDKNIKFTYDGLPMSHSKKENFIYIIINNFSKSTLELLKFNTDDGSFDIYELKNIEENDKNTNFKIISLDEEIILIDSLNFDVYNIKYDNLGLLINNGNLSDYGMECLVNGKNPTQIYDFTASLDDNNLLIGVNDGANVKLIKIDKTTGILTQILNDVGYGYTYVAKPAIDRDYMYISFIKHGEINTISKYNWKNNELVKETTLDAYFNKNKQIGNITMYEEE